MMVTCMHGMLVWYYTMQRVLYDATVCSRPHDFRGVLPQKRICGLRTVRPRVHSAATISQINQLHVPAADPLLREGVARETTMSGLPGHTYLHTLADYP